MKRLIKKVGEIRRLTAFGYSRETTIGWVRALVTDMDRLLAAIERGDVKEAIGPNTARVVKLLTERQRLKEMVNESFPSMKRYAESLDRYTSQETFTIEEKSIPPVGEYFREKVL